MADKIWQRIKLYIPEKWYQNQKAIGLNERLRFLRYDVGQKFEAHMDGCYQRQDGEDTTFIDPNGINSNVKCVPKTGMALVFEGIRSYMKEVV
ncbi:unnamed protein product [Didymodactylos carnosus]|uniref:Uncharacterized protein n=1 Tax=Didymodactylos carnosus TaxID=1234261 RepID=A0A8S2D3D1_9BILA|nr:unnamed protein product [Didymodactylos carnosus]CAF3617412.1 unnamed protein product [Didymodactylos carnosus]